MPNALTFDQLINLAGEGAVVDVPCPLCGPTRPTPARRSRNVFRIWGNSDGFISYHCARCGESGYARDRDAKVASIAEVRKVNDQIERYQFAERRKRSEMAKWLWSRRAPVNASPGARYFKQARSIHCSLPSTIGFLPAFRHHPPALIAAFGFAEEIQPGVLTIANDAVIGVHLTKLTSDGSAKAHLEPNKLMIGHSVGAPIMLAPCNDNLGLVIAEGIEDALTAHADTGLGAWAAGSASRLPALAEAVPSYVDCVTILADDDEAGRKHSAELRARLKSRGFNVLLSQPGRYLRRAA